MKTFLVLKFFNRGNQMKSIKLISVALLVGALAGCSTVTEDTLTKSDITRLLSAPKIQGYPTPDEFSFVFSKDGVAKQFTLATIKKLQAPKKSCFQGNADCFEWVPVQLEVKNAYPATPAKTIMVRLFPNAEQTPDLSMIQVGDLVLAATTAKKSDDNKLDGYSLGWLFSVSADGTLKNLDPSSSIATSVSEVDNALGSNFARDF